MKKYEVAVYRKYAKKNKKPCMKMMLSESSNEKVQLLAFDVMAGMTFKEVFKDEADVYAKAKEKKMNDIIGWELAEKLFTVKANVLKN